MEKRVLVTYATKAGSTAEVADRIGQTLSQRNLSVEVQPISKVTDLSPYQAVVIGSAIRVGRPLPEVTAFIEKHQAILKQKPFSLFIVCMTLSEDNEANRKTVSAYLDPVRALVQPAKEGLFAGVMNPSKLGLLERFIIKVMKAPVGDFRQWDQITTWAESLPTTN